MPSSTTHHRNLPSWLAALLAQLGGILLAFALARTDVLDAPVTLVLSQAVAAALLSLLMKRERWWVGIHLGFMPLLLTAHSADVSPLWYLTGFMVLLLMFWGTLGTRVPLYLSGGGAVDALDGLLPTGRPLHVLDIGCGTGAMLVPLAHRHPEHRFTGIESAPLPWLIARIAARRCRNLRIVRGDFFAHDWSTYDVVYAFLSTHPMARVEDKARDELGPRSLLISKDFAAPQLKPEQSVRLPSGATLYCYRPGGRIDSTD